MSLIAELKRRSVFKVAGAYLVVAWIVIQVGATVAPQLGLPDWAPRLITLIVLLGLPVTLVVAWLVEVTPEGIKVETAAKGNKRVFTVAAVIFALSLGWFLGSGEPARLAGMTSSAEMGDRSTAVLPFVNMSADKNNDYFSDGLTEILLHKLAQVPDIKVAARTSSFAFKGKNIDIRRIGAALGVATVLEGSVQRSGSTLRITAQLVRTLDGSHIWSRSYDRQTADLFAIQDEIAAAVTQALVGALVPGTKAALGKGGSKNLEAYDDYIRGLHEEARNTFDALEAAERSMKSAIQHDPEYIDALLGLVAVWQKMADTGLITPDEFISRSAPLLDRVDGLEPGNGVLLGMRSVHANIRGDDAAEARLLERAVAAAPGNADLLYMFAGYLVAKREFDSALAQIDLAIKIDPLNASFYMLRAQTLSRLQRFDEGEQAARRSLELNPDDSNTYATVAFFAKRRGDLAGNILWDRKAARTDPSDHEMAADLALEFEDIGEPAVADAWIAESRRLRPGNLFADSNQVQLFFNRGQHEATLAAALAIVGRHSEERRSNWVSAMANACLSARKLGRVAELRNALVQAHALPSPMSVEGIKALATPTLSVDHQISHIGPLWVCLVDPGDTGSTQREQLLAIVSALEKPDWEQRLDREGLAALLHNDREKLIVLRLPPKKNDLDALTYRQAAANYLGIANDPRIIARFADIQSQIKQQHAKLPALLAADGLTILPR